MKNIKLIITQYGNDSDITYSEHLKKVQEFLLFIDVKGFKNIEVSTFETLGLPLRIVTQIIYS